MCTCTLHGVHGRSDGHPDGLSLEVPDRRCRSSCDNNATHQGDAMRAIVGYESQWGNTAAVARAIAEGLGQGAQAMNTDEAVGPAVASADLVVAGAPVVAFGLPREGMRKQIAWDIKAPTPPDL